MSDKVTKMVLKVDLQCCRCYKKVKKVLCKFPQIRDQIYDEKTNTVTITVVCCNPEKLRDKICSKGGGVIINIEIKVQSSTKIVTGDTEGTPKKPPVKICPPPVTICPPPIKICQPPVTICPSPEPVSPPPVKICPPPVTICPPPEPVKICPPPVTICPPPEPVKICPPPVTICPSPEPVCPPPVKICPPTKPVCPPPTACPSVGCGCGGYYHGHCGVPPPCYFVGPPPPPPCYGGYGRPVYDNWGGGGGGGYNYNCANRGDCYSDENPQGCSVM